MNINVYKDAQRFISCINVSTSIIKIKGFQIIQIRRKTSRSHFWENLHCVSHGKTTEYGLWLPSSLFFTGWDLFLPQDLSPLWCSWWLTSTSPDRRIAWGKDSISQQRLPHLLSFLNHQWEQGGKEKEKRGHQSDSSLPYLACAFSFTVHTNDSFKPGSWKKIF